MKTRNPVKSYEDHFYILGPKATNRGAVDRAKEFAWNDFERILTTGRRLIVTATHGRGVRLKD